MANRAKRAPFVAPGLTPPKTPTHDPFEPVRTESVVLIIARVLNRRRWLSRGDRVAGSQFRLVARVSTSSPELIRPILGGVFPRGRVREQGNELVVEDTMEGSSAKDLNRAILSALRKVEKRTRLRSEWTAEDGTVFRFFDYVLKSTKKPQHCARGAH